MSPGRTSREALDVCPFASILPRSHAREASERVLKNRAAHNHLSILTRSTIPLSYPETAAVRVRRARDRPTLGTRRLASADLPEDSGPPCPVILMNCPARFP